MKRIAFYLTLVVLCLSLSGCFFSQVPPREDVSLAPSEQDAEVSAEPAGESVTPRPEKITLSTGEEYSITLDGNPTTGYEWHCTIGDTGVLEMSKEDYNSDSDADGAGGTYHWTFTALAAGETKVTFKYYRDGDEEPSADDPDTVVYQFVVE